MPEKLDTYIVTKTDGTPIDPNACYFVLRVDTDPVAMMALGFYARLQRSLVGRNVIYKWMRAINPNLPVEGEDLSNANYRAAIDKGEGKAFEEKMMWRDLEHLEHHQPQSGDYSAIPDYDLGVLHKLISDATSEAFSQATGRNVEYVGGLEEAIYSHVNDMLMKAQED